MVKNKRNKLIEEEEEKNRKIERSIIEDWLKLKELEIPTIKNIIEVGKIYNIERTSHKLVSKEVCEEHGIISRKSKELLDIQGNEILLPAVLVKVGKNRIEEYRLPLDYTEWCITCALIETIEVDLFPSKVEFGVLEGRKYANFVFEKKR